MIRVIFFSWALFFTFALGAESSLEYPSNCLKNHRENCLVRVSRGHKLKIKNHSAQSYLSPLTSVIVENKNKISLMHGAVFVRVTETYFYGTENTLYQLEPGQYLITKKKSKLGSKIQVLEGRAILSFVGDTQEPFSVHEGYEVSTGPVNVKGFVQVSFPSPILFKQALINLKNATSFDKQQFKKVAQSLMGKVKLATQEMSEEYKKIALRNVAEDKLQKERRRRYLERVESENSRLRALFRKKNYLD